MQVVSSRNSAVSSRQQENRSSREMQSAFVLRASVVNLFRQSAIRNPQSPIPLVLRRRHGRPAFTLVEMMVAVALTLLMMTMVVSIFSLVMDNVSGSRATIEMTDKLRFVRERLQRDLAGVTVIPIPPRRPENGEGYFEYIEGPIGPCYPAAAYAVDDDGGPGDYTVGDNDDILLFTTKSQDEPFVGRYTDFNASGQVLANTLDNFGNPTIAPYDPNDVNAKIRTSMIESQVAEVAWFLRGTTLYRRVLLVAPSATIPPVRDASDNLVYPLQDSRGNAMSFYGLFDISVRHDGGGNSRMPGAGVGKGRLVPNTLGDLTNRQNRFGHQPYVYPYDARLWGTLRLPTLRECSSPYWPFPWNDDTGRLAFTNMGEASGTSPNQVIYPWGLAQGTSFVTRITNNNNGSDQTRKDPLNRIPLILGTTNSTTNASDDFYYDAWNNPMPWSDMGGNRSNDLAYYASTATRMADDVIMTNVVSFDVKIWDPWAPILPSVDTTEAVVPMDRWLAGRKDSSNNPIDDEYAYIERVRDMLAGSTSPISLGAFVDLNYLSRLGLTRSNPSQSPVTYSYTPTSLFGGNGDTKSQLVGAIGANNGSGPYIFHPQYPGIPNPSVYDTWSTSYEQDGIDQDAFYSGAPAWKIGVADEGTNGIDDDGANGVDDPGEQEAPPPYASPLRAIQVKIRVFEPDSRQIREVTLEHEFLPQ